MKKNIIKVINSLENRGIWLKGTTRKIAGQKGRFLSFLKLLMIASLPLMRNVLTPLAKSVLIPLELTLAGYATDAASQKNIYGSGATTLIVSNEEMEYIMKKS